MNVVIRTDASIEIGTGHVMRCLTLAKQLKRHGAEVTFVCRNLEGNSISYLKGQGIRMTTLPLMGNQIEWQMDAEETITIIKEMDNEVDLIIVDHYGLDSRWESELRHYTKRIMVIDDLADRPHDCDLLLDQNYYLDMNERYKRLVPNHCIQMLGPNYVLLREEFLQIANKPRERTGEVNNILVFFGGTDPTGETIKTLKAIRELNIPQIEINVVVGASNPKRREIELMCKGMLHTNFYCQVSNMAELMWQADLAIGAGGSTTWERCLLGLPTMVVIIADNQREVTHAVAKQGSVIYLGEHTDVDKQQIQKYLLNSLDDMEKWIDTSKLCLKLLDSQVVQMYPVLTILMEGKDEYIKTSRTQRGE